MSWRRLAVWFLMTCVARGAAAQTPQYLRYVSQPAGQEHLDTALAHFQRGAVHVDLVAAIHIAQPRYYRQVQKRLDAYPKLLFELISDDGQSFTRTGIPATSQVSRLQLWIRDKMKLAFQLDAIDYRRKNFVHADLAPDDLLAHMQSHWTETLAMFVRWMLLDASRTTYADGSIRWGGLELLGALKPDADVHPALMRMMARELAEMGDMSMATAGGDVLIARRNDAAVRVLETEIAHGAKRLGIFYGGAHMPDLERKLLARGFRKTGTQWLVAWQLGGMPRAADVVDGKQTRPLR